MSNQIKELRKQLRPLVKELLPETLSDAHFAALSAKIDKKLAELQQMVLANVKDMNERHRDTMSYLVRQTTKPSEGK